MAVDPVQPNVQGITPSLVLSDCAAAIDGVDVSGAEEILPRVTGPDGEVGHAGLRIAGSTITLDDRWQGGTPSPATAGATTVALVLCAADAPEIGDHAIAAGAEVIFPYELQSHGDHGVRIRDPGGHRWSIDRHLEDVDVEEMARRMAAVDEQPDS